MNSAKYLDLNINKDLLDPKFSGYKLSLREIKTNSQKLPSDVERVQPNVDQYSFIHTKLFTLHNHLFADPWDESAVYFVSEDWNLYKGYVILSDDTQIVKIWNVPENRKRKSGHFNFSLIFSSQDTALLSDGAGTLHIVHTGARNNDNTTWRSLYSNEILGEEISFIVVDARYEIKAQRGVVNCVLMTIEPNEDNKSYDCVLSWVTLNESQEDGNWGATELKVLRGKDLHYCALEQNNEALYVAGESSFKFLSKDTKENAAEEMAIERKLKPKLYTWQQTSDDITVTLKVDKEIKRSDLKIATTATSLTINIRGNEALNLKLAKRIDVDLTTWETNNEILSVVINKEHTGLMWNELVDGGDLSGEQIIDPTLTAEIHARLAHLCSDKLETGDTQPTLCTQPLEECDVSNKLSVFERFDKKMQQQTHVVGIGGFQVLFKVHRDPGQPPAIVLRYDVDGVVLQPDMSTDDWKLIHVGTLHAFGYVQASKEQKKFITCSPDLSYAIVAESSRHIFVYRQKRGVDDGCELRNRRTETEVTEVAEQQLINLIPDDILGIVASNKVLFVLKSNRLMFFYI